LIPLIFSINHKTFANQDDQELSQMNYYDDDMILLQTNL